MKIQEECLPCIVNQAIRVAGMVGLRDKSALLRRMFGYLSAVDFDALTTPELIGEIFAMLKQETGNPDPYRETRRKYNQMFLTRLPALEQEITASADPFGTAVRYAIIGNIIDFNPIHALTPEMIRAQFDALKSESLWFNDCGRLLEEVRQARTLLYLGDNCGEICLDKLLIRQIRQLNPECRVYFATRGTAVVNDSIEEDAYLVGMDEYAAILSNGDSSLGTVLSRTSAEFNRIFDAADVVIAKGQANYECLSTCGKGIYFLLMTKCAVIARDLGCPEMKMILRKL